MTTRTVPQMLQDVEDVLGIDYAKDGQSRRIHVYQAQCGSLQLSLTDAEAQRLDTFWYGEKMARRNQKTLAKYRSDSEAR